jgi:membrane protein implicated in regulation of membrane protease activity
MFPLTDLSILFIALLIVALLCLGLIVLMGMLICRMCKRNNRLQDTPIQATNPSPAPVQQQSVQPDISENIDNLRREVILGTYVAICGLAFAFAIYAVQTILSNHYLQGIIVLVLSIVMLSLGDPRRRRQIGERLRHHTRLLNIAYNIGLIVLIVLVVITCVLLITHI